MSKIETFVLDAFLKDVIKDSVFRAVLPNGHEIVAFPRRNEAGIARSRCVTGRWVQVEMSPFDMSRGRFVFQN